MEAWVFMLQESSLLNLKYRLVSFFSSPDFDDISRAVCMGQERSSKIGWEYD